MSGSAQHRAAFVGLATWDLIYVVDRIPALDEKVVALDAVMHAGGPATNASVTFSRLGGEALLVSLVGATPVGSALLEDLHACEVVCHDISPPGFAPPISSAFLTAGSGCRAVVSLNGSKVRETVPWQPEMVLKGCELLLVDGHYPEAALKAAQWGKSAGIPVLLDGGSWKPGTEALLGLCDVVIASSRFLPPGCECQDAVLGYLESAGIRRVAVTDGENPIIVRECGVTDSVMTFPSKGIDTTGAGDVFHGAFAYFHLEGCDFKEALGKAARIAAEKCDHLGGRTWLNAMSSRGPSGCADA